MPRALFYNNLCADIYDRFFNLRKLSSAKFKNKNERIQIYTSYTFPHGENLVILKLCKFIIAFCMIQFSICILLYYKDKIYLPSQYIDCII